MKVKREIKKVNKSTKIFSAANIEIDAKIFCNLEEKCDSKASITAPENTNNNIIDNNASTAVNPTDDSGEKLPFTDKSGKVPDNLEPADNAKKQDVSDEDSVAKTQLNYELLFRTVFMATVTSMGDFSVKSFIRGVIVSAIAVTAIATLFIQSKSSTVRAIASFFMQSKSANLSKDSYSKAPLADSFLKTSECLPQEKSARSIDDVNYQAEAGKNIIHP